MESCEGIWFQGSDCEVSKRPTIYMISLLLLVSTLTAVQQSTPSERATLWTKHVEVDRTDPASAIRKNML